MAVLVYTYIKICYIHVDLSVFNRENLLNWLYYGLNLHENLQNMAGLLRAYINLLLMVALIFTYYMYKSMKHTNNLQITPHTLQ